MAEHHWSVLLTVVYEKADLMCWRVTEAQVAEMGGGPLHFLHRPLSFRSIQSAELVEPGVDGYAGYYCQAVFDFPSQYQARAFARLMYRGGMWNALHGVNLLPTDRLATYA
jgi:hypothetical protein